MKRIVICADGTWNRPEKDPTDQPTNVLKLARGIKPRGRGRNHQQVFYDWGIGSYHDQLGGGVTGRGINKNIMDAYRYIVQNYAVRDELYLFGFSRGAYTVRSLCGLINNCGILKRPDARLIQQAFNHYKKPGEAYHPDGKASLAFRKKYSHADRRVKFVGVWDTVGALGIPFSFLGFLNRDNEFYDTKIGANVDIARHALAIDEQRSDFEPTIWANRPGMDLKQVWFTGSHGDIGGGYAPDKSGGVLSDIPFKWLLQESRKSGLSFERHLFTDLKPEPLARLHHSRKHIYRSRPKLLRDIEQHEGSVAIHDSVKNRWDLDSRYRPANLTRHLEKIGWGQLVR